MIAGELANLENGQRADRSSPDLGSLLPEEPPAPAPISTQQAAEMLNVGRGTVEAAKKVIRDGVPELAEAVRTGELAVSAAAGIARQPADEQATSAAG